MPTAREIEECCEFRKRLAKEKLKKEQKKEASKKEEKPNCCGQNDEPCCGSEAKPPAPKKKRPRPRKKRCDRCPLDLDEAISIIQPTYGNREKYIDVPHIHCVLDAEESARLKKLDEIRAKWRDNIKCAPEEADDEAEASEVEGSMEGESKSGDEGETDGESKGDENQKGKICKIGKKGNKQAAGRDKQNKKNESKEDLKNKSACSSICSLDSEIDVSEFALTCEEIRMIDNSR